MFSSLHPKGKGDTSVIFGPLPSDGLLKGDTLHVHGKPVSASSHCHTSLRLPLPPAPRIFNTPVSAATGLNRFFALGTVKGDEPRRAVVLTYVIAQSAIFIGGLDAVAPILTK